MERTSLTDFQEEGGIPADASESDTGEQPASASSGTEADIPDVTSVWSDERRRCTRCGETVHRRWPDGDTLVCTDCVDW